MMRMRPLVLALLILLLAIPVLAQNETPLPPISPVTGETANPNAAISWPPPVYVVRGPVPIRGSANLPNMTNYFLEYRPYTGELALDTEAGAGIQLDPPWFPVSLPSNTAVQNDVLATWTTSDVPDGLYELRLTVNVNGGSSVASVVRPIRVENTPPPFAVTPTPPAPQPTSVQIPTLTRPAPQPTQIQPTQPPPSTATSSAPSVTVSAANANVRSGDSTLYPVINSFPAGTVFQIVGLSANNTGWFVIQLPNGNRAWIAPSVVQVSGSTAGLPRVQPPPPPVTPTFTPVPPTATPITAANLFAGDIDLDPDSPRCNETFNVGLDVTNTGSTPTLASGTVSLQDFFNGQVQEQTIGGFPILQPGQTFRVNMPLTVDTNFDAGHTLVLIVDSQGQVPETNEGDNRRDLSYTLTEADC